LRLFIAASILGLLAGGVAASSVLREPALYSSRAVLVIDQPGLIAKSLSEGVLVKLNQLRIKYSLLARTTQITKPVADKTGLPPGLIAGAINVALPGPSLVLIVEARAPQPPLARVIADATAEQLIVFVKAEQDAAKIAVDTRIILTVAAPAQQGVKVLPTRQRAMTVGALWGALVLSATIGLVETVGALRRKR
jgi:hypothetical protein